MNKLVEGVKLEPALLGPYVISKYVNKSLYEFSRNDMIAMDT